MIESEQKLNPVAVETPRRVIPLRRRIAYVAVIYCLFLVLLLGVEVITRLTMAHVSSLELFVGTPQQKLQVADQKQSGIFEGDPLLLWRLRPNLKNVVWDFTVLSTNGQGFRADYRTAEKPPATFRIICLGDSVTFGYRVPVVWPDKPTEYNPDWLPYPMLLEKHLRGANPNRQIEVFPMAVPGYTSHQGLAWLQRDIDRLQPDIVIASFGWNDVSLSDVPDREAIRTDWYPVTVRWLIDHSQAFAHATRWLRNRNQPSQQQRPKPVPRVSKAEYLNNFSTIVRLVNSKGVPIIVIGAPYRDSTTNPPEANLIKEYRTALRSMIESMRVPYVEILELTEAAAPANDGFFGELIHPNHMGHRLMAAELTRLIAQKNLADNLNVPPFMP